MCRHCKAERNQKYIRKQKKRVRVQNYFMKLEKWSEKMRLQCTRAVSKFLHISKKKAIKQMQNGLKYESAKL